MSQYRYGQWKEFDKLMGGMTDRMNDNMERATKRNLIMVRDQAKKKIADTDPEWPELLPATIKAKGSSKPLFNFGDLMNSIKEDVINPFLGFVGVRKDTVNEDGDDMVSIAAVHEFGSKDGNIPMRSFLRRTFWELANKIRKRYLDAMKETLLGKMYHG